MIFKSWSMSPAERMRQDPPTHFTLQQQLDRAADELVGLCRGLLSDDVVSSQEATFLRDWIDRNQDYAASFPFNVLYRQLADALADGVLDPDEESDLLATRWLLSTNETSRHSGLLSRWTVQH